MEDSGKSLSGVEHIIAIAGASSSSEAEKCGRNVRDFDINQPAPEKEDDEEIPEGRADDYAEEGENENPRRKRLRLSEGQTKLLEESFRVNQNISHWDKEELAVKAKLKPRQVEVWFQNRRVSFRMRQMESERAYLRQHFGPLMEENLRLQREVEELLALIAASPTSILTLCPSCDTATPSAGTQQCSASTLN